MCVFLIAITEKQMNTTQVIDERILKLSMRDTVKNSLVALPLVMLFEVYMIVTWCLNVDDKTSLSSFCYLVGYVVMLVFSGLFLVFIQQAKKDIDRNCHRINYMQHFLALVYVVWALAFTFIGSEMRGHFDYLIFITFMVMVPLFCFLNPYFWSILQLVSTCYMFYLASHQERFFAFFINFSVFTIISLVAGWSMHRIRRAAYQRQIDLEIERNHAYDLAHKDSLTGLHNRQSCNEDFEKLKCDPHPEDIIILMCDVNGLKPVNDLQGHEAGDELLQGAAYCLQQSFQSLGTIYRVGGDEFTGILHGTQQQLEEVLRKFEWVTSNWSGKLVKSLSISIGYASVRDNPGASLDALQVQADDAMYERKRRYYEANGITR